MKNFTLFNILVLFALFFTETISAQMIIGKPSLQFGQACASPSFNTYNTKFSFTDLLVGGSNQFIIELSDSSGSFSNPTVIYTSAAGAVTTSQATLSFSLPITTAGEAYKIRIKSTSPAATSPASDAFAAYYKIHNEPFSINNLVSSSSYCSGGSYILTIDNPGTGGNNSPLQYPSLTYNWYKVNEANQTTSDFVASGQTLSVSTPGTYFVRTNYGTCTSDSYSNAVTITEVNSGASSSIDSSLGNPFCPSEGSTTLSTVNGDSYKWFKDGIEIPGATNRTYVTNETGTYSATVNLGTCTTSASIDLEVTGFTSSIDVPETNTLDSSGTLVATITTDAINPEFQWFLNETIIASATSNSFEASESGNYKVIVTQTEDCVSSKEFLFSITEPFPDVENIPNMISPNGDNINDTWVIPQKYITGTNTKIAIMNSQGKVVFQTDDYQNNWPENQIDFINVNPVYYYVITTSSNKTLKGSITVVK
ncbi:gliding motility-associated C-terminal domain-containing protein [Mariniflexile gromovii]|uniref:Gliding motility-associated C-terminal domain-containing protein n=1 Tax=Mariniflexile gromovii TaxID=362523 RepID=A0ABS4BPB4_9FLAO|nr:gliding motility-associated C-terminal domain-containing protein [Mariniflexile gromovii]MBP0902248.1 gliding motility-associated C-terminal domain-containing protein [Mariniflexile gromovii]